MRFAGLSARAGAAFSGARAGAGASVLALSLAFGAGARGEEGGFSFAIITDVHVGRDAADYGTPGYDDRPAGVPRSSPNARHLAVALEKLRVAKELHDIRFVLVLGDITDKAERSEFAAAKAALDTLPVPYFPVLGNHDVWPHTRRGPQAPGPIGDTYFEETFGPVFASLRSGFPDLVKEPGPVWNPERRLWSRFQNYAFSYRGFGFLCLDWVSRRRAALGLVGAHAQADLHDFPGGTYPWASELLASGWAQDKKRVFVFQHHPLRAMTWGLAPFFTFSRGEKAKLRALLSGGGAWGVFAGHQHRSWLGPAFDVKALARKLGGAVGLAPADGWEPAGVDIGRGLRQVETAATMTRSAVTVVRVGEDGKVEVLRF